MNVMINSLFIQSNNDASKQQGLKLLDELFEKNKSTAIPWYCKNTIVNAIIYDKMNMAEKLGVDFNVDVNIPEEVALDLTDLCSIFTNLIDNALNSAKESSRKKAELSAKYDMGMIFVISKNYPDSVPEIKPNKEHFSDGRLSKHGYGLSILNDIAEKYEGSVKIKTGDAVEVLVAVKG